MDEDVQLLLGQGHSASKIVLDNHVSLFGFNGWAAAVFTQGQFDHGITPLDIVAH
jgi:hypothetical protein